MKLRYDSSYRFSQFVSLTLGLLMLVLAVECIVYRSLWLAVCACMVSAFALGLFVDLVKTEIIDLVRHGQKWTSSKKSDDENID